MSKYTIGDANDKKINDFLLLNYDHDKIKMELYHSLNELFLSGENNSVYNLIDFDVINSHKSVKLYYSKNKDCYVKTRDETRGGRADGGAIQVFLL